MEGKKKLKYTPPKLRKWGTVASLTMAGEGVLADGKSATASNTTGR
jgi:hypothetical protein